MTAAILGSPVASGSDAVVRIHAITRAMVENDIKLSEDYDAAVARENYIVMQSLLQKDIFAVIMLPNVADKWEKLADDYASVSDSFAILARTKFHSFKILNGENVIETQHSGTT